MTLRTNDLLISRHFDYIPFLFLYHFPCLLMIRSSCCTAIQLLALSLSQALLCAKQFLFYNATVFAIVEHRLDEFIPEKQSSRNPSRDYHANHTRRPIPKRPASCYSFRVRTCSKMKVTKSLSRFEVTKTLIVIITSLML